MAEPSTRTRVVVAHGQPLMVDALRLHIDRSDVLELAGTARDGDELIERRRQVDPDVIVVDHALEGNGGLQAAAKLLAEDPALHIVVLVDPADAELVSRALEVGCSGCVTTHVAGAELVDALAAAGRGEPVLDAHSARAVVSQLRQGRVNAPARPLSDRELQVLKLASQGLTNAAIAERLFVSPQTVKTHLERIYRKLDVSDRVRAVMKGVELGMLDLVAADVEDAADVITLP